MDALVPPCPDPPPAGAILPASFLALVRAVPLAVEPSTFLAVLEAAPAAIAPGRIMRR